MYLVDWKEILPVDKVQAFQPARYLYLIEWKDTLPAVEVLVPRRPEGFPSSRSVAGPLEGGYPRIPAAGADADGPKKQPVIRMLIAHLYLLLCKLGVKI
jgi:hypothetical protein